jgi:hypothetical protein
MVIKVYAYIATRRRSSVNSHLYNAPQIAAERGLPGRALALVHRHDAADFAKTEFGHACPEQCGARLDGRHARRRIVEHNFGDSEFLMLFLVLVTLPYAADRSTAATPPPA